MCTACLVWPLLWNFFLRSAKYIYFFCFKHSLCRPWGGHTTRPTSYATVKISPAAPYPLGQISPIPYTDALFYMSSRHFWEMQYPYSASALVEGGWPVPRPDRFTPGKTPLPILQEAGWASGPVRLGLLNLLLSPGFEPPGSLGSILAGNEEVFTVTDFGVCSCPWQWFALGTSTIPKLCLLTDVFQLQLQWAKVQSCFVRVWWYGYCLQCSAWLQLCLWL
jgi:hypothetical protein